jgi:hypothetical protein
MTDLQREIIRRRDAGQTVKQIWSELNLHNTTVRRILLQYGRTLETASEAKAIVPYRKLSSYWLGMMATDGTVHHRRTRIELSLKDKEHVEKFRNYLSPNLKIYHLFHNKYGSPIYRVCFSNKGIYDDLVAIGITPQKSSTLNYKGVIDYDFLRGVIDGDGTIFVGKKDSYIAIYSKSRSFIVNILLFMRRNKYRPTIEHRKDGLLAVKLFKKEDKVNLLYNLYKDAHTYLERKYVKAACLYWKLTGQHLPNSGNQRQES